MRIWTFSVCVSVRQLHREFLRAGANVMQTFTFYASDDKLVNRGQKLAFTVGFCYFSALLLKPLRNDVIREPDCLWLLYSTVVGFQGQQINEAACDLAKEVANEGDALVAGGICQTPSYLSCKSESEVKAIFKKQVDVFVKKNVDFLIAEVCIIYDTWILWYYSQKCYLKSAIFFTLPVMGTVLLKSYI